VLKANGVGRGDRVLHYFSDNRMEDVACRLGASMVGAVPVTVNWQADTEARIVFKATSTNAKLALSDASVPAQHCTALRAASVVVLDAAAALVTATPLPAEQFESRVELEDDRMVIFTSGTTGDPKGVRLPYRAYDCNRSTFESFLALEDPTLKLACVLANPFHHTNSTAISDWCLRRPGSHLHILQRYSTGYWAALARVASGNAIGSKGVVNTADDDDDDEEEEEESVVSACVRACGAAAAHGLRVVAPVVSKHFDFLEALMEEARAAERSEIDERSGHKRVKAHDGSAVPLEAPKDEAASEESAPSNKARPARSVFGMPHGAVSAALGSSHVTLLLGSAPVGPATVKRIQTYANGALPTVRFGSTETCLQVVGTPHVQHAPELDKAAILKAFQRGWAHTLPKSDESSASSSSSASADSSSSAERVAQPGYYIGRSHPPFVECAIVESVDASAGEAYLKSVSEGVPGLLITRGCNLMTGYTNDQEVV